MHRKHHIVLATTICLGSIALASMGAMARLTTDTPHTNTLMLTAPVIPAPDTATPPAQELQPAAEVTLPTLYIEKQARIKHGQTLSGILIKAGIDPQEAYLASNALNKKYRLRDLRPGQKFLFSYHERAHSHKPEYLNRISLFTREDEKIEVLRQADGDYVTQISPRPVTLKEQAAQGTIDSSLYMAASDAGLPDSLIVPFMELFSWDLDFTRDIRDGDHFKVVFEKVYDENGEFVRYGHIVGAELDLSHGNRTVSAFLGPDGNYYNKDGLSKRKTLLRTPLKFTRISSRFQVRRKHPVLGYTRAHKGTDFAAPTGTPIKAAGDGRIVELGWKGGYGRYVRIEHNKTFSTAYGHMSRWAKGMKAGRYVHQGDVIGYVGMSGLATGPHLHYEVLIHHKQVDAMKVKLPNGAPLAASARPKFKQTLASVESMWQGNTQLAAK